LSTDTRDRMRARDVIVPKVKCQRSRMWNGKAKNSPPTLEHVRKLMHVFHGERSHGALAVPSSRKLWHALREVDNCSTRLANYAERYRAGLRVGTSVTEGTANFLVNRRMNKAQQMRWSRQGADCCRFGVRSTTARSGRASAICLGRHPIRPSNYPWRLDPPTFWTLPPVIHRAPDPCRFPCAPSGCPGQWLRGPQV
jgi:hypothetical protein